MERLKEILARWKQQRMCNHIIKRMTIEHTDSTGTYTRSFDICVKCLKREG